MSFIGLSLEHPVVRRGETTTGQLGSMGARFVLDGIASEGRFGLIEHPIIPRGLAAPMHRHTREDEYSFVLEGRWGFQLGDNVVYGEPGDLVYKPRNVWHSFWNDSDESARLLEIISPAGFEHYFDEVAEVFRDHGSDRPDLYLALQAKYGLEMDFDSAERLVREHGLVASPGTADD